MSISPKFVQGKLVTKVQELVKGKIWEYPNGIPAVFKSNAFYGKTPPSPKMPYIAIDFFQTLNPFQDVKFEGWLTIDQVPESVELFSLAEMGDIELGGGELRSYLEDLPTVYTTLETKIMQFTITVYGSDEDDTLQIASELSTKLKASYNRDYFMQFETGLYSITNPVTSSTRLSDQYRDVSSFTIGLSYVDRVIDEVGGGSITSVNIDTDLHKDPDGKGGLYRGFDDNDPLDIQTGDMPENN